MASKGLANPKADGFSTVDLRLDTTKLTTKVSDIDGKTFHRLTTLNDVSKVQCTHKQEQTFNFDEDFNLAICITRMEPHLLKTFHRCFSNIHTTTNLITAIYKPLFSGWESKITEDNTVFIINYPKMKNHHLTRKAHTYMDSITSITNEMRDIFEAEVKLDLFSILSKAAKITTEIIGSEGNHTAIRMTEDTALILAQNIMNDQCLVLTQEAHQLHLLALQLQKGVLDPNKNSLDGSSIPRKILRPILRKANKKWIQTQGRKIAIHEKNYNRKTIGTAKTFDKAGNFGLKLFLPTVAIGSKINEKLLKHDPDFSMNEKIIENQEAIENFTDDKETYGMDQKTWDKVWTTIEGTEGVSIVSLIICLSLLKKKLTKCEKKIAEQDTKIAMLEKKLDLLHQARNDQMAANEQEEIFDLEMKIHIFLTCMYYYLVQPIYNLYFF